MVRRAFKAFLATIIISVVVVPGAFAQKTLEKIVARVNNEIILESEVEQEKVTLREGLAQSGLQGPQLEQAYQDQSKDILRDLIDVSLLLQTAKDLGLSADLEVIKTEEKMRQEHNRDNPDPKDQLATIDDLEKAITQQMNLDDFKLRIKTTYLKDQVLQREVYSRLIITTEDLRAYYDSHKKDFERPEGVQLRDISVNIKGLNPTEVEGQRKKIDEALAAVRKGAEFGDIAQKYSDSESARNGGELGFFEKGVMAKDLEDLVNKLDKGQTSDVIKTGDSFMVLQVEDKHPGGVLPFESTSTQNEVYGRMFNDRALPKVREYLTKLRGEGFVEVKPGYNDTGAVKK